jgi:NAD(P)H dehydrogenase (quinone)
MAKILIAYFERSGNTESMANAIADGVKDAGCEPVLKKVEDTTPEDLRDADGFIIGSPTYYGLPAPRVLALFEESVKYHGELEGKVGGAFATSANVGGGNETTVMALLQALLVHGYVVQGSPTGDHFGPVSVGAPDRRVKSACREYGARLGALAKKLAG